MSLSKGFLRPKITFNKYRISTGIMLGTAFSFGLYGVFYYFRETLRIFTSELGGELLIILSPREVFYYNLFFGSISAIIGFYVFIKFVFENSIKYRNHKLKLRQRHILNEQAFFGWSFLSVFGRFATVIGLLLITLPIQFDINFLKEFPAIFILLPIVLYLNIWPSIFRLMGGKGYKWLLYSFLYISTLSLIYGNMNLYDYRKVNKHLKQKSVELSFSFQVPVSVSHHRVNRFSLATDLYVVNDSMIFWNDAKTKIELSEISYYVNQKRDKLFESERNQLLVNLHIDKNVKMSFVNKLKYELRKAFITKIQYSTGLKNSKYPSSYTPYKYWGLEQLMYPYYNPDFVSFLDSAERLDFSKYKVRFPDSPMYRNIGLKKMNRVEIRVGSRNIYLNKKKISKDKLDSLVYILFKRYSPNFAVIFIPDEDITYGMYIEYLDLVYTTIDKLRNELSLELFGQPFIDGRWGFENDSIKSRFPRSIVQWTSEEKRVIKLMNKSR